MIKSLCINSLHSLLLGNGGSRKESPSKRVSFMPPVENSREEGEEEEGDGEEEESEQELEEREASVDREEQDPNVSFANLSNLFLFDPGFDLTFCPSLILILTESPIHPACLPFSTFGDQPDGELFALL